MLMLLAKLQSSTQYVYALQQVYKAILIFQQPVENFKQGGI